MDRILSGLYGTGDNDDEQTRVSKANDFVSRVESGNKADGYSMEEAVQNYRGVTQELSDDEFEQVAEESLRQLSPEERREFTHVIKQQAGVDLDDNTDDARQLASLTKQLRSGSGGDVGGLLGGLLGGGGSNDIMGALGGLFGGTGTPAMTGLTGGQEGTNTQAGMAGLLNNPIVKTVLGLIAANAMKRFMGGGGQSQQIAQATPQQPSSSDSGGGGFLGGLFGGGDDNTPQERDRQDRDGGGLLDSLFGGGDDDDRARTTDRDKTVDVSRIERDRKPKGI